MKARSIAALILALIMLMTTCFSLSVMAEEEPATVVVYNPVDSLNAAAGDLGIGGTGHVSGTIATVTYDDVFALSGADTTEWKHPDQNIDLNKMKVESDNWNNALCFYPADYQYDGTTYSMTNGYVKILEYTKNDPASRALWWACGEDWYCQKVKLTFTAPEAGKYDIAPAGYFPNVKITNTALGGIANATDEITFAILKGDQVLSSVGVSKNAPEKAFPAVSDVELAAGETITFCVSAPASLRAVWWGTVIEATPVITYEKTGDAPVVPEKPDVPVEPDVPTDPVVYNPIASLNAAAGDLGIGGTGHVSGTIATVTYDDVFALSGADTTEWKHPDQNIDLNKMKVESDNWNNALCFYPADYQYDGTTYSMPNGYVKILEYTAGDPASRALWWACGEDWYCQKVKLTFTAPYTGKYDINATDYFPNVKITNGALGGIANATDEITFAILKGDEVLSSVGVSKNASEKAFPALTDVELAAGETITFCVSAPASLRAVWWGTVIEATPVVTFKGSNVCRHEYVYACDKVCSLCGELTNEAATHTIVAVEAKAPTCTELGNVAYWYCSDCGAAWLDAECTIVTNQMSVKLGATCSTNAIYTAAKAPTCYEPGNVEYWYCANCDVYYADAACTVITNAKNVILPIAHNVIHVEAKAPTCTENGNIEYWYCADCGQAWLDELCRMNTNLKAVVLGATCSTNAIYNAAKAPTCYEPGNVEYWYCANCDVYYADAACTVITNAKNVILPIAHNVIHVEAKAPTCTEIGNIEYWYCADCGQAWLDEYCHLNTNLRAVVLPIADHVYSDDYDVDCDNCGDIRVVEYEVFTFGGNSVSEDVSGLAFKFNFAVEGMTIDGTLANYTNATVTPNSTGAYKLITMGAVVSNGISEVDITAKYLCNWGDNDTAFAVRIINIPESGYDTPITARPYYVYEDAAGNEIVVYGAEQVATYNGVLQG